jgi:hypothetical protein
MLVALTLIVSACSTRSDKPTVKVEFIRPDIPAEARIACPKPVQTEIRKLTAAETFRYWDKDRTALKVCEQRRRAAVEAAS